FLKCVGDRRGPCPYVYLPMTLPSTSHSAATDETRFAFGRNWARFLSVLDNERIAEAETSLTDFLELSDLQGRTFLDIGSGSGLFSLAAKRLGEIGRAHV